MPRLATTIFLSLFLPVAAVAQKAEPITAFGHGGFFGPNGEQVPITMDFVTEAQAYYKSKLVAALPTTKKKDFETYEVQVMKGIKPSGQDRLILEHQSIEWLIANTSSPQMKQQCAGRLRALRQTMNWKIPEHAVPGEAEKLERYTPSPKVVKRLASPQLRLANSTSNQDGRQLLTATRNLGQAYIDECRAAGVPIPPTINMMDPNGTAGWRSEGFIPQISQFIVGTPAELRSYKSTAPEGMCFALPRYTDTSKTTVELDGVICMGKQSSKVCFWDNQMSGTTFTFPAGTQIPIGVASSPGGLYQGGGKEIEFGGGGVCTDCHAGENPYIIHPNANLAPSGTPVLWQSLSQPPRNMPTMAVNRYDPLVGATWPQNESSQAGSTLPSACTGCHFKGSAGRLPHLSIRLNGLQGYCPVVLGQAITKTMPQGSPGSAATAANAFKDTLCKAPNASNRSQVLFYYPGDDNWWLGSYDGSQLKWNFAGNTKGFGHAINDGRPFWVGRFSASDRDQVLFYYPGDDNWWLGSYDGSQLKWTSAGDSKVIGHAINDGRPFWIGDFNGDGRSEVLLYDPGNDLWWLGSYDGTQLKWTAPGSTKQFGHAINDGRPFWIGKFSASDRDQVLFYYPGDDNWWLGSYDGSQLSWSSAGNTQGFGHAINDGRPFWTGDFNGDAREDVVH